MSNVWFTSDWHLFHKNIIDYSHRPFRFADGQPDLMAMHEALVANHNAVVKPGDRVYFLGDLAFPKKLTEGHALYKLLERFNGQKFWVKGNHDSSELVKRVGHVFVKVADYLDVKIGEQYIALSHYPMLRWNRGHYGAWMLHGHCHGELRYPFNGKIIDVGVDAHAYAPVSFDAIDHCMRLRGITENHEGNRE